MAATKHIKLDSIKEPTLSFEVPEFNGKPGYTKEYELYELNSRWSSLPPAKNGDGAIDLEVGYDNLRRMFEMPTAAEAKKDGVYTLSRAGCEILVTEMAEAIATLPERKRFFAAQRMSSGSTD